MEIKYSASARETLRRLSPALKPEIKKLTEGLALNPHQGKPLRDELVGYWRAKYQRWRIVYAFDRSLKRLMIHLIERRATIYETVKALPPLKVGERHTPYGRFRFSSIAKP